MPNMICPDFTEVKLYPERMRNRTNLAFGIKATRKTLEEFIMEYSSWVGARVQYSEPVRLN